MGGILLFGALLAAVIVGQFTMLAILRLYLPWLHAMAKGVPLTPFRLTLWRMTGVPSGLLIETFLKLRSEGPATSLADIEAVYLGHTDQINSPNLLAALVRREMHGEE